MSQAPADDVSIAEHGHDGHIKGRPISWVVVGMVIGGFIAGGIGMIIGQTWLFITGLSVVAAATILGGLTHAMADMTARVEAKAHKAAKAAVSAAPDSDDASREPARS